MKALENRQRLARFRALRVQQRLEADAAEVRRQYQLTHPATLSESAPSTTLDVAVDVLIVVVVVVISEGGKH
jgi:hypothetical protein